MLQEYQQLLTQQPDPEQARRMLKILSFTIASAQNALPDTEETRLARCILEAGVMAAVYENAERVADEEDFMCALRELRAQNIPTAT